MIAALLLGVLAAATSTAGVERFLPCTPGLTVVYDAGGGSTITERVRGPGGEPNGCVVERTVARGAARSAPSAYLREHLPSKISYAGELDAPLAFRPPLLRAPIQRGKRWRFNTTRYEVLATDARVTVKAGTFEGCARVEERSEDGKWTLVRVYAPGVGLILSEGSEGRLEAAAVVRARKP